MRFKYVSLEVIPISDDGILFVELKQVIPCKNRKEALMLAKQLKRNSSCRIITEEQIV